MKKSLLICLTQIILTQKAYTATYSFNSGKDTVNVYAINSTHIQFDVTVPDQGYFSLGFGGTTMTDVDVIVWLANGVKSKAQDYYSTGESTPVLDSSQDLQTSTSVSGTNIQFSTIRALKTGDSADYDLKFDANINCIYAYYTKGPLFVQHSSSARGSFTMKISSTVTNTGSSSSSTSSSSSGSSSGTSTSGGKQGGVVGSSNSQGSSNSNDNSDAQVIGGDGQDGMHFYKIHGFLLWSAWGIMGLVQIASNRYLKVFWRFNYTLHVLSGFYHLFVTLILGILGIKYDDNWKLEKTLHSIAGLITIILVGIIVIGGLITKMLMKYSTWKTQLMIKLKFLHKLGGFLLILLSQVVIFTGILWYQTNTQGNQSFLAIIQIVIFCVLLIIFEIIHQIIIRGETPYTTSKETMSVDEFQKKVQAGSKLVVLDQMVLNIGGFIDYHPGGKFVFAHCVGRDISKFFYGGYALENGVGIGSPYTHSNTARKIVNTLIVARLTNEPPVFNVTLKSKTEVNSTTTTFILQLDKRVEGISPFYRNISMIGKHYLVQEVANKNVKRHYTITNCMRQEFYKQYISLLDQALEGKKPSSVQIAMDREESSSDEIVLTIKNYKKQGGLSQQIHTNSSFQLKIKGPMGKGLDIQKEGTHIAFTGGTGCLVFMDLVAHLIRKQLNLMEQDEQTQLNEKGFTFIFYVSFQSREDSIALELLEKFDQLCKNQKSNLFQLQIRLSNQSKARWNKEFIDLTLKSNSSNLKKIWVCGPPKMNEEFDKNLLELTEKYSLTKQMIEIM